VNGTESSQARVAVVVGGSTGIGAAVVEQLLARGDVVTVVDRVAPTSNEVTYVECDLLDHDQVMSTSAALPQGIGALAYVAGIPGTRPAKDVLTVNFLALRTLLTSVEAKLVDGAAIAVVASTAGTAWTYRIEALEPLLATTTVDEGRAWQDATDQDYPAYSTSKEAAILFAKRSAPRLWSERSIRINTVSPGPVETAILVDFEESMGKDVLEGVRSLAGRHATPADIAPVVEAVLSPDFGWITGQDIQADAGSVSAYMSGAVAMARA
jgi:NAD(P)-dependent dehydrogenase (short-subunit alcohol dehydrogenase family)